MGVGVDHALRRVYFTVNGTLQRRAMMPLTAAFHTLRPALALEGAGCTLRLRVGQGAVQFGRPPTRELERVQFKERLAQHSRGSVRPLGPRQLTIIGFTARGTKRLNCSAAVEWSSFF